MNSVSPITLRCIERPAFDNTNIAVKRRWISDNTGALARYLKQLTDAIPPTEQAETSDADLQRWLDVQYELELLYHDRARLPHGSSL